MFCVHDGSVKKQGRVSMKRDRITVENFRQAHERHNQHSLHKCAWMRRMEGLAPTAVFPHSFVGEVGSPLFNSEPIGKLSSHKLTNASTLAPFEAGARGQVRARGLG